MRHDAAAEARRWPDDDRARQGRVLSKLVPPKTRATIICTPVDLSVVIACKNEAHELPMMLDSLARQTWAGSWELVIADNGSTDSSVSVAEGFSDCLPRLLVVDASERPGPGYARNRGVEAAQGDKILFVDGDDEVEDGYIAAMAAALDDDDLVFARIGLERLNPPWVLRVWSVPWQQTKPQDGLGFLAFAGSGTLGIRRSVFEEIGGFDCPPHHSQFEEADLCWRVQLAGYTGPALVEDAVLHYRLPTELSAVYRRAQSYARGHMALHDLYKEHGMPPPRRASLRDVAGSLRRIRSRPDLARAAQTLGRLVGQCVGAY
jgi:glycosyltransferase involved in cell wall biosynthesis